MRSAVPCAVKVKLDVATALRAVAALHEGAPVEHLNAIFQGTAQHDAILTLCSALDKVRLEHHEQHVRLIMRLAVADEGGGYEDDLDVRVVFAPLGDAAHEPRTPSQSPSSSAGSSISGAASTSALSELFISPGPRAPSTA